MASTVMQGRALAELRSPRRNRFYYGKLLDALHLTMEQEYTLAGEQLLNRMVLGPGVVCGLDVTPIGNGDTLGLRIGAGLALDGWGRRIVVPDDHDLVPLELTTECGVGQEPGGELPSKLVVAVCYRECEADFAPALVPEQSCNGNDRCEAGTIYETYSIRVREGTADDVVMDCMAEVTDKLVAGDLHGALCLLGGAACGDPPSDPCVVLANVSVIDGRLEVEPCRPRTIVPTNRLLLQLVVCLAQRIEECCGDTPTDTPTDGPTDTPTDGPKHERVVWLPADAGPVMFHTNLMSPAAGPDGCG